MEKKIVLGHMGGSVNKACDCEFSSGYDLRAVQSMRGILCLHFSLPPFLSAPLLYALSLKNKYINFKKGSSTYGFGKTGQQSAKQNKNNGPLSYNIHKNKSNMDNNLYVKPETIKIPEDNMGSILFDIACTNVFVDISLEVRETQAKIMRLYKN